MTGVAFPDTWHLQMCSTLYGTCQAARRTQLAWAAYAASSNVSPEICVRTSFMPVGSLSNVLGVSTAAPTVRSCLSGECRAYGYEGTGKWEWGKGRSGNRREWERGLSRNRLKWDPRALVGFHPSALGSVPALCSLDLRMPRTPKRAPSVLSGPSRRAIACEIRRVLANRARDNAGDGDGARDGASECSDIALVSVSVLKFEGPRQKECASMSAQGLLKRDRVRALRNKGLFWIFSSGSDKV
jgi:hypothetical protein